MSKGVDRFELVLDETIKEFSEGEISPDTAEKMAREVMRKVGVQKVGYQAVEKALELHYGTQIRGDMKSVSN